MKVYELLDAPEKWTQGHYHRVDENGQESWCLYGAVTMCYPTPRTEVLGKIIDRIKRGPEAWNDDPIRTYEQVIALAKELDI